MLGLYELSIFGNERHLAMMIAFQFTPQLFKEGKYGNNIGLGMTRCLSGKGGLVRRLILSYRTLTSTIQIQLRLRRPRSAQPQSLFSARFTLKNS